MRRTNISTKGIHWGGSCLLSLAILAGCGTTNTGPAPSATAVVPTQAAPVATVQATVSSTNEVAVTAVPQEAQCYFDAVQASDAAAVAACFAEDGLVIDVGRRIAGQAAIQRWAENEVIGGVYQILEVQTQPAGAEILLRFAPGGSGGFRARYSFSFENGKIKSAELQYA